MSDRCAAWPRRPPPFPHVGVLLPRHARRPCKRPPHALIRTAAAAADNHVLRKYEIVQKIGRGAYGIVWKAVDKKSRETVALTHSTLLGVIYQLAQAACRPSATREFKPGTPQCSEISP